MRWILSAVALFALVGCGSSESAEPEAPASPSASASPTPAVTPEAASPTGAPEPQALSEFRCSAGEDGSPWTASGLLSNSGKDAATYQVSVYVGPLDGDTREVRTLRIDPINPGESDRFDLDDVPAGGDTCHVQVLRTP
ncbi:hypothetical protein [Aeromicrobium sp. CF3.5]|uniref:hypothetical protein n=1 Tax=Aeromicrobium sp. CF3.5 TaxID=3373078 RepID=UPI003EE42672